MLNPIQLVQGSTLKINLETDHIILRGSINESAGTILRGSVVLDCNETIKIRSISLKFMGRIKVGWTEGKGSHTTPEYGDGLLGIGSHQRHYKQDKTIIQHEWSFMPPARKPYHFSEGHYKWDFEVPLPGDLPEGIHHPLGEVSYRLKAVAERPAFSMNYTAKKPLRVSRVMLPSAIELTQSVCVSNVWTDKLSYDISIPGKVFALGSIIPITFELVPIKPQLKIKAITCCLKEYVTLSAEGHTKVEGRIVKYLRDDSVPMADRWSRTEMLAIPNGNSSSIRCDAMSDLIKVKHKLKFTVSLINPDGHVSELRAAIPLIIALLPAEETSSCLPAYEDTWQTAPYETDNTISNLVASGDLPPSLAIAIPNEAANRARSSISERGTEPEPSDYLDPLPWYGIDLSRVPSYTTAMRSERLYSFSGSLPTYDSIAIPGCSF